MRRCLWLMIGGMTLALPAFASAQAPLRFKFQKGDTISYIVETKNRSITSVMGKDVESEAVQVVDLTWHVDAVDESGMAQATIKFGPVKVVMEGPKGKVALSSTDAKEPEDESQKPLHEIVQGLAKVEVTCQAAPTGEISKINVKAEQLKGSKAGAAMLAESLSEDALKRMLLGGVTFSKGDPAKDKEWTEKLDMKVSLGQITGSVTFALDGTVEQDGKTLHKIATKPEVVLKPKPNPMAELKVKGPISKGSALFDAVAGRLVEVAGTQTIELSAEMNDVLITQQLHVTSSLRLKK